MGAAVPYAIAAKFAHPECPVVVLVGDGAMQMNNLAEMITVQKYWQRWTDPQLVVCMFKNGDLNEVTCEQRVMEGNPRFGTTQDLPDVPYARFADSIGLKCIYVDDPERLGPAWDEAIAADRPVILEVRTDPDIAPLPPHVTLALARAFLSSAVKGDKRAGHVVAETTREALRELLPHERDEAGRRAICAEVRCFHTARLAAPLGRLLANE